MLLALLLAFLVVPLVEVYVIVQVGHLIGLPLTLLVLLLVSVLGARLVRQEGRRAWRALSAGLGEGRVPTREVLDGALVLVGGVLLVAPGFVTDAVGLLLVLPVSRPALRRLLTVVATRRLVHTARRSRAGTAGRPVIDAEVVNDRRPPQP
jgi:UPF0716 protein FxsA